MSIKDKGKWSNVRVRKSIIDQINQFLKSKQAEKLGILNTADFVNLAIRKRILFRCRLILLVLPSVDREFLATGASLSLIGIISLVSPIILNTFSDITKMPLESLQILSVVGVLGGIGVFIIGLRSRK